MKDQELEELAEKQQSINKIKKEFNKIKKTNEKWKKN